MNDAGYDISNFDKDYWSLKTHRGVIFHAGEKYSAGKLHLTDKNGTKDSKNHFYCNIISDETCNDEINNYFKDNQYGKEIDVKYDEIKLMVPVFIFLHRKEKLIYEINYQGKTIYSHEYFINKFHRKKMNLFIFTVLLIVNSIGFGIIFHNTK